jgi:hypothetical protein
MLKKTYRGLRKHIEDDHQRELPVQGIVLGGE